MTLFTWVQHSCTFNIVVSLFNHLCQMFVRRCTPSVRPSLLMFRPDHPIARISSPLVLYRVFALVLSLWRSDRNRMDSYRLSMLDVPEYPIASGTKGPWQQQRCDSLHCYEEWWDSVPPSVVVLSCVHAIKISALVWFLHKLEVLIAFWTSYICEIGFSSIVNIKTKFRGRLQLEND